MAYCHSITGRVSLDYLIGTSRDAYCFLFLPSHDLLVALATCGPVKVSRPAFFLFSVPALVACLVGWLVEKSGLGSGMYAYINGFTALLPLLVGLGVSWRSPDQVHQARIRHGVLELGF